MTRTTLFALTLALLVAVAVPAPRLRAFPEPSIVQRDWQFEFEYSKPQSIAVVDVDGKNQWYWFITYKVTNDTGNERLFIPELTVATAEGDIVRAGRNVPALVFARIKERTAKRLLESPASVVGRILQGEDNARESVIVWPAFDHDISRVSVFIGGLSGEAQEVPNPVTGDKVLVNKTLMIDFDFPGNPTSPQFQTVTEIEREWIMR